MAKKKKNLSEVAERNYPNASKHKVAIVVSEWNPEVTGALLNGAIEHLIGNGVKKANIDVSFVPGSFELPLAAKWKVKDKSCSGVIALGCVIQGETRHFDFICDAVANGIMNVGLESGKPAIFGVLTTNDINQAIERSGGKHGNKGVEAADTLLRMLTIKP